MSEADLFPEKKLLLGGFAGLAAAIVGAIIWAVVQPNIKSDLWPLEWARLSASL
jgi:hypothetical protein